MCDQLSILGVEFSADLLRQTFTDGLRYSAVHPFPYVPKLLFQLFHPDSKAWGDTAICKSLKAGQKCDEKDCHPRHLHPEIPPAPNQLSVWKTARPWSLGQIRYPSSWIQVFAGTAHRRPGLFNRTDPETNDDTGIALKRTDERVHSSVRVRLACRGLGLDDRKPWECTPLTQDGKNKLWKLQRASSPAVEAQAKPNELSHWAAHYPPEDLYQTHPSDGQFCWVIQSNKQKVKVTVLPEEPLIGYWEKMLLHLTTGEVDVWRWAEEHSLYV